MDIQGICHDFVFIDLGFSRMTSFFAVGLGCDSCTPLETLRAALEQALARADIAPGHIVAAASITLKAKEPGLLALVAERG